MNNQAVLQVISRRLHERLRAYGFRRSRHVWNRLRDAITDVIEIQASRYNDPDNFSVTLNVGIWMPEVWDACWGEEAPIVKKSTDCYPTVRIGELVADGGVFKDLWWSWRPGQEDETAVQQLEDVIARWCLPFFDHMGSLNAIKQFCEHRTVPSMPIDRVNHAILCHLSGDRANAPLSPYRDGI